MIHPDAHVEDGVEGEERGEHHDHRDQHLGEGEAPLVFPGIGELRSDRVHGWLIVAKIVEF